MRLFVGVYPPEPALDHLAAAVDRLHLAAAPRPIRLVPRSRWHLTLAFLGDTPDDRLPAIETALSAAATSNDRPVTLRLAGAGRFGRGRSTVLWVGLAGDLERLRQLGTAVRRELRRRRVSYDRKPLRPHLTLARPGDRLAAADLGADLATLAGYEGPAWTVDTLRLVRSRLGPNPVHEVMSTAPLAG